PRRPRSQQSQPAVTHPARCDGSVAPRHRHREVLASVDIMDLVRPFLAFLDDHRYVAVFAASVIDATGIPFPARIVLVLAGAVAATSVEVALTITAGAVGAVLGDHVLYAAGRRGGGSVLALYYRPILGSGRCLADTTQDFRL